MAHSAPSPGKKLSPNAWPCAVCGGWELEPHVQVDWEEVAPLEISPYSTVQCARCGHIQVRFRPDRVTLAAAYAEGCDDSGLGEEKGQRAGAVRALARIERYVSRGALCDVGCSIGLLLSEANQRGWNAVGIEPSHSAVEFAREVLHLNVISGTLESADLPKGHFDAVVMTDVFEHLEAPAETLVRVAGLLRPGGALYLELPDAGSILARVTRRHWWSILPTHVHYFTRASLTRLLSERGWVIEWSGTAPKAFTVRSYLGWLGAVVPRIARCLSAVAERWDLSDRLVWLDFRDRMAIVARPQGSSGGRLPGEPGVPFEGPICT
jgi:2-polyprenyl-3-methyl-5-hydroxy-6-metoxy-1,4-benzoquinol methylase